MLIFCVVDAHFSPFLPPLYHYVLLLYTILYSAASNKAICKAGYSADPQERRQPLKHTTLETLQLSLSPH